MSNKNRLDRRKKTITRTFRIRKGWDDVLQEEAARQGVSVNVLLNKILRKYSLYSRWADRNNDMSLPQQTIREILKTVPVENLAEAGRRSGASDVINIVNAMGLALDYDSFVYLMSEHLGGPHFARWFHCFHHTQGNTDIFHLQHDLGRGWSVYLERYVLACLRAMTDTDAKTRVYDYAVTFEVTRPRSKPIEKPR
ncbi:MAG: hypothetical protein JSW14_00550 [Candidatus Bathyarchaeum sp.]|nr:MAG: hypothetical protein JSW14_00550 [Candidatus Bathyarchaeum sp.]